MKPSAPVSGLLAMSLGAIVLAGCSGTSGVSTASIFGGDANPSPAAVQQSAAPAPVAAAPAAPTSDPTSRAFQVGAVSARATKCGYNFDAAKLKQDYLAAETGLGATPEDMAKIEKVYTVALNGVTKAIAKEADYCSTRKTEEIKADLTRALSGDYSPPAKKVTADAKESGGLFSGLWSNDSSSSSGVINKPSTANDY
jgi:hypothetical protein